jgi:hypothetical protein
LYAGDGDESIAHAHLGRAHAVAPAALGGFECLLR